MVEIIISDNLVSVIVSVHLAAVAVMIRVYNRIKTIIPKQIKKKNGITSDSYLQVLFTQ